jgi:putative transposase
MSAPAVSSANPLPVCWILDRAVYKWQRKTFTLVGVMDLRSRKMLHWQVLRPLTPQVVADVLDETIRQYGLPPALVVGADPVFINPALVAVYQTHDCHPVDLRHGKSSVNIFTRSLWKNVEFEGLSWMKPQTEVAFREAIDTWLHRYNHERPHQALGYKTPAEQWQQNAEAVAAAATDQPATEPTILPLTIRLVGTEPPIWRRVLVRSSMTFAQLHQVFQLTMGWTNAHLHEFQVDNRRIGPIHADLDDGEGLMDEKQLRLDQVFSPTDTLFQYTYDFGDGWEHEVHIEPWQPAQPAAIYPVCIEGGRNCPPEDCGGVPGYEHLLTVLADKAHPDRAAWLTWLGGTYNPDLFQQTFINRKLAMRFR